MTANSATDKNESALRRSLLAGARRMVESGLNRGTSGNLGIRSGDGFLITPSGVPVDRMKPETMVKMDFSGKAIDSGTPSSEWRFHRDIFFSRPEVGAVVHTHSMFATTLACMQRDVPPFHYMIAAAGGDSIRCAPYALFGSQELSDFAMQSLENRKACLLSHHGMIALWRDLDDALALAEEVEALCEQYWRVLQLGEARLLSPEQMHEALERFKGYGQWGSHTE